MNSGYSVVRDKMRQLNISKLSILALCILKLLSPMRLLADDSALQPSAKADRVIVLKAERKLILMKGDEVLKSYRVSLGGTPLGPKTRQGDSRTPEGKYFLDRHNSKSHYYKSIHISYPNANDLARARKLGVPPGGDLFVHGLPNGFHGSAKDLGDWTDGCVAVTDPEMDEIWRAVADGTPIEIKP
jgi:murein L,D-transpeptidase YafK